MNKKNQLLYILLGILLGIVIVLGGMFYYTNGKMQEFARRSQEMEQTMEDTIAQLQEVKGVSEEEVEAAYVDPDEPVGDEVTQTPEATKKAQTTKKAEAKDNNENDVDPETEFDDLTPQMEGLLTVAKEQVGGQWSVYVEDLDTGGNLLDGGGKMEAASLIKLYIMGAVYENYDAVKTSQSNVDNLLSSMITVSDNSAANELVTALGGGDAAKGMSMVNSFCTGYEYEDTSMGRLLESSNDSGDNYTSVEDCGKFLSDVYSGVFKRSEEMLEHLKGQERRSKIPAGVPEGIVIANKTGELDDVQNDVAIVYGEKTPYILCIMTQGVSGTDGPVSVISNISNIVYGYTNQTVE